MTNKARTVSTMEGWTKTDRQTYTHYTGLRLIRDTNRRLWVVAGASQHDGRAWSALWVAMHYAAKTPAAWA